MKTFKRMAAQGDFVIIKVDEMPTNIVSITPENGNIVVAHSETGHNHVMVAEKVEAYKEPDNLYEMFLLVKEPTPVEHLRSHDTHEPLLVPEGLYQVRRQREYIPNGFRLAAD